MGRQIENIKLFHNKWIEQVPEKDRDTIKKLLTRIFPKFATAFGGASYGVSWESTWKKQLKICSMDIFPVYFRLSVPKGQISYLEMQSMLTLLKDNIAFANKLLELKHLILPDGSTRASAFLERIQDFTEKDIHNEHIPNVLQTLFDIGDVLLVPEDERRGMFGWGNDVRIGRIMFQLLKRYQTQEERFEVLNKAFLKGRAVSMIVSEVTSLGQQHGKYGARSKDSEAKCLISLQHVEKLEKIALKKVKDAVLNKRLIRTPHLAHILYRWRDWEGIEIVRKWVNEVIASDETLVDFLAAFLSRSYRQGMDDRVSTLQWRLDPKSIKPFIDPTKLIERCKNLLKLPPEWLKNEKKIAVETFIKWFELQAKEKNPEWELDE